MANDNDFTFANGRADLLGRLYMEQPNIDLDDPMGMILGVLWFDQEAGLKQDNDYILISIDLAIMLLILTTPTDPSLRALLPRLNALVDDPSYVDDEAENELADQIVGAGIFEVTFTAPPGLEYDETIPEFVRGKTIRVRAMNQVETKQLDCLVQTIRGDANGTFITLPAPTPSLASIKEANA